MDRSQSEVLVRYEFVISFLERGRKKRNKFVGCLHVVSILTRRVKFFKGIDQGVSLDQLFILTIDHHR